MEPAPDPGRGVLRLLAGLGHISRTAAALTAVLVIAAGAIAVTVVLPRTTGAGAADPTAPAALRAPAGWHSEMSLGSVDGQFAGTNWGGGIVGANLLNPAPRIAIHVVCNGPAELIVMASTEGSDTPEGRPLQAARFACDGASRVELVAIRGQFQGVLAVLVRDPSTIGDIVTYVVSIEVPDETPAPTALR
jgi:hypothetical protein